MWFWGQRAIGITFKTKKSHCLFIGPTFNLNVATMSINEMTLTWVDKICYLGIVIVKDEYFTVDLTPKRRNFYSSVNCIFNKSHLLSDMAKLYLTEAIGGFRLAKAAMAPQDDSKLQTGGSKLVKS
jgi:flagellar biosynthesis protein FliQ